MSAVLSHAGRLWRGSRFHLSALILVLPLVAFPQYFKERAAPPLGAHILPERQVGPFTVTLAEYMAGPPRTGDYGRQFKDFTLRIHDGYPDRIRTAYLRVGKPPNLRTLGDIAHGDPNRLHGEVRIMEPPRADDSLWLTLEEWDGTLHHAAWPLGEVMTQANLIPAQ
jgi:hypothetical protein